MSNHDPAPLRELRELLAAFVAHPIGAALVVGCPDSDMPLLVHAIDTLDGESPADLFVPHFVPFTTPAAFVDALIDYAATATDRPPTPPADPHTRLQRLIDELLAHLPEGDHRLVLLLAPPRIDDPAGFAELIEPLLARTPPAALRIVIRDDLERPHAFQSAATSASHQVLAHRFRVPAETILDDITSVACDPSQPSHTRATALLQLAGHAYASGQHSDAVARCESAIGLTHAPQLLVLALTLRADALHAHGDPESAHTSARAALALALECRASPLIHHAATTLGKLSSELGDRATATACSQLAERTAPRPPSAHTCNSDPPC